MLKQEESLLGYISDMKNATNHLAGAFARQIEDDNVKKNPAVLTLITRLHQVSETQVKALQAEIDRFGGSTSDSIKEALTSMTGALTGLYDKVRSTPVSKMLRDDYTALSLAVVSNEMLHVTALAANDALTARVALSNMEQLAPLIIEVGEAVLAVVQAELEFPVQDTGAAEKALANVRQVWKSK